MTTSYVRIDDENIVFKTPGTGVEQAGISIASGDDVTMSAVTGNITFDVPLTKEVRVGNGDFNASFNTRVNTNQQTVSDAWSAVHSTAGNGIGFDATGVLSLDSGTSAGDLTITSSAGDVDISSTTSNVKLTSGVSASTTGNITMDIGDNTDFDDTQGSVAIEGRITQTNDNKMTLKGYLIDATNLSGCWGLDVDNDYAYIGATTGLTIVDVSDKENPVFVSSLTDNQVQSSRAITVKGRYCYMASIGATTDAFAIVDINDKTTPVVVGYDEDAVMYNSARDVVVSGDHAFVTSFSTSRLVAVNISDPTNPYVTSYESVTSPIGLDIVGTIAYTVGGGDGVLTIIDISDPSDMTVLASLDSANIGPSSGLDVRGKYLYCCQLGGNEFIVVDVEDPTNPLFVTSVGDASLEYGRDVRVVGDYAYVTFENSNNVGKFDISDPTNPTFVNAFGSASSPDLTNELKRLRIIGNYIYTIGNTSDALAIIDINGTKFTTIETGDILCDELIAQKITTQGPSYFGSINVGDSVGVGTSLTAPVFNSGTSRMGGHVVAYTCEHSGTISSVTWMSWGDGAALSSHGVTMPYDGVVVAVAASVATSSTGVFSVYFDGVFSLGTSIQIIGSTYVIDDSFLANDTFTAGQRLSVAGGATLTTASTLTVYVRFD